MPNGGVPMHMVLTPQESDAYVVYCRGAELRVIAKSDWDKSGAASDPSLALTEVEVQVLERFLRYWLHDKGEGPIYRQPEVNVVYDF